MAEDKNQPRKEVSLSSKLSHSNMDLNERDNRDRETSRPPANQWLSPRSRRQISAPTTASRNSNSDTDRSMQSPLSAPFTRILEALNAKVQPLENEIDDYMGPTLRLPSAPIGAIGNAGMQRSQSDRTNVSSQYARSPNRLSKQRATSIDDVNLHIHDDLIEELSSLRKKKYSTNAIVDNASVMATAAASDYVGADASYNQAPMYAVSDTTKDQPAVNDDETVIATGKFKRSKSLDTLHTDRKDELLDNIAELDIEIEETTHRLEDLKRRRQLLQGELKNLKPVMTPSTSFTINDDVNIPKSVAVVSKRKLKTLPKPPIIPIASRRQKSSDKKMPPHTNKAEDAKAFALAHRWDSVPSVHTVDIESEDLDLPEKKQMYPRSA